MNQVKLLFLLLIAPSLAACSDDPEWSDPEAHERNVQLKEQYGPLKIGTWPWA